MRRPVALCLALSAAALTSCHLLNSPGGPRVFEVAVRLEQPLEEGEPSLVATWEVPGKAKLANRLIQLSGRIEGQPGAELPGELIVRTEIRNLETGELRRAFRLIVDRTLGGPYLTQAELAGVVEWIENGAADN